MNRLLCHLGLHKVTWQPHTRLGHTTIHTRRCRHCHTPLPHKQGAA